MPRRNIEVVPDNLGHANFAVTQIVYGKSWWEELSKEVTDKCYGFPCSPLR
jgi:hypothetical protein